jgi:hypothetical protein
MILSIDQDLVWAALELAKLQQAQLGPRYAISRID